MMISLRELLHCSRTTSNTILNKAVLEIIWEGSTRSTSSGWTWPCGSLSYIIVELVEDRLTFSSCRCLWCYVHITLHLKYHMMMLLVSLPITGYRLSRACFCCPAVSLVDFYSVALWSCGQKFSCFSDRIRPQAVAKDDDESWAALRVECRELSFQLFRKGPTSDGGGTQGSYGDMRCCCCCCQQPTACMEQK